MILRRKALLVAAIITVTTFVSGAQSARKSASAATTHSAAYNSMADKLDHMARNATKTTPDPAPVKITANEANAWVNEGGVKLPAGVDQVKFRSEPSVITTNARVDFDKLMAGRTSRNPLLYLFSGVHQIEVVANASATGGTGNVNVQTLSIDGTEVPRMAMELFVDHYLTSKYPGIGLDNSFRMPARVNTAVVGRNEVTVTQK